jgi:hypothetical protein
LDFDDSNRETIQERTVFGLEIELDVTEDFGKDIPEGVLHHIVNLPYNEEDVQGFECNIISYFTP